MNSAIEYEVEFLSPGTLVHETTARPIEAIDVELAARMSRGIVERHGAKPFAFRFHIFETAVADFPSGEKKVRQHRLVTPKWFIGCRRLTLEDIPDTPENEILRSNMSGNDIEAVAQTISGWRATVPIGDGDQFFKDCPS